MDVASLLLLLALAAVVWFWFNGLSALEVARNAGRQVCRNANVQFLDDTVASTGLALVRNEHGRRVLRRTYRFEFSETGNSRLEGQVVLLGNRVKSVTMEPYQIMPQSDTGSEPVSTLYPCDDKSNGGAYGGSCCGGGGCGSRGEPGGTRH
jgi:hypothetical protein